MNKNLKAEFYRNVEGFVIKTEQVKLTLDDASFRDLLGSMLDALGKPKDKAATISAILNFHAEIDNWLAKEEGN